jgi:hypothetical protein
MTDHLAMALYQAWYDTEWPDGKEFDEVALAARHHIAREQLTDLEGIRKWAYAWNLPLSDSAVKELAAIIASRIAGGPND